MSRTKRNLPSPYSGYYRYFRRPRFFGLRKALCHDDEHALTNREKSTAKRTVTDWDDVDVAAFEETHNSKHG